MMTASDWVDHWLQRAPLIAADRMRELLDTIAGDDEGEGDGWPARGGATPHSSGSFAQK